MLPPERNSDIKNNPLIAELMSLLGLLNSPVDNNAFAQFCLGDLMPRATGIDPQVLRDFLFRSAQLSKQGSRKRIFIKNSGRLSQIMGKLLRRFFPAGRGAHPLCTD